MSSSHGYTDYLNYLRGLADGMALSKHTLDLTDELLKKIDPSYRFDITLTGNGQINLDISLPHPTEDRAIKCFLSDTGSMKILMWGAPKGLLDEGKSPYTLPDEVSECAEFINKCLHSFT